MPGEGNIVACVSESSTRNEETPMIGIMDLHAHSCRYIVRDMNREDDTPAMFCGERAADVHRPYCHQHRSLMYVASRPRGVPVDMRPFKKVSVT